MSSCLRCDRLINLQIDARTVDIGTMKSTDKELLNTSRQSFRFIEGTPMARSYQALVEARRKRQMIETALLDMQREVDQILRESV